MCTVKLRNMKMEDVASNLCYYDKRNPDNNLDIIDLDDNEIEAAKKDCHCDNCFYGRTKLAEYIINLEQMKNLHKMTAEDFFYNHWQKANKSKFGDYGDYDSDEYAIAFAKDYAALCIHDISDSLRNKLEYFVAKYWYDNEYQQIDKQDQAKATESREKFQKWFDDNIEAFLKQ